ncbi:DUF721 domain-containing protein [Streptomyces sp. NPDC059788]|uniref:DUF721 domain-containing protein n=1 Tax=Streptomyces sp. NPDC059788 TaxID=3346948 RepID=UPI00365951F1
MRPPRPAARAAPARRSAGWGRRCGGTAGSRPGSPPCSRPWWPTGPGDVPAAGGSVLDQWPDIAAGLSPKLAAHVQAVAFHAKTGQLDLRPDSPAYATQLRLITARIIATANSLAGTDAVRTVRILPPGAAPAPRTAPEAPAAAPTAAQAPVKTREMGSPGFHQALSGHLEAAPLHRRVDPAIAEAAERQTVAMRELSRRSFSDPDAVPDDALAPIEQVRLERRRQAATTEVAALRRARAERAGATPHPRQSAGEVA